MRYENQKQFLVKFLYWGAMGATIFFILKYVLFWILPFVVGILIAFLLKPLTVFITHHTGIRRKGVAFVVIAVFYTLIGVLLWLLGVWAFGQLAQLIRVLPDLFYNNIEPFLLEANEWFTGLVQKLSPEAAVAMESVFFNLTKALAGGLTGLSGWLVTTVTGGATKLPMYLITFIFSIVCSVFISLDYNTVVSFLLRQLPPKGKAALFEMKDFLGGTLFKMCKAYLIILAITIAELFGGFLALGVEYALPLAACIGVLDIMPFIGTGGVLIPWALFEIVTGNIPRGVGLLILYGIVTVVRNIIEPKIVGQTMGLHPVLTITAMYAGLRLFGFVGFICAPIVILMIKFLNENGRIHLYK